MNLSLQSGTGLLTRLIPWILAAILSLVSEEPRTAGFYKSRLPRLDHLVHLTIEVNAGVPGEGALPVSQ